MGARDATSLIRDLNHNILIVFTISDDYLEPEKERVSQRRGQDL